MDTDHRTAEQADGLAVLYRRHIPLVDGKTRRKLFRYVLGGHALALVVPMAIGVLLGFFHFHEPERITIAITDAGINAPPGETAATAPNIPAPPTPNRPDIPTPPTPVRPTVPTPPTPNRPTVPTPPTPNRPTVPSPPTPNRPTVPSPPTPTPARPTNNPPTRTQPQPNRHQDDWTGITPSTASTSTGQSSGQVSSNYQGQLSRYIDLLWDDAPKNAPDAYANSEVTLELTIEANGRISNIRVVKRSGYAPFDQSVQRLIGKLREQPGPAPGHRIVDYVVNLRLDSR